MTSIKIPVFGQDQIDGNWVNSDGYTQTETCDIARAQVADNLEAFAEGLYYQLNQDMPRIGVDDIDGDFPNSMGYSERQTCQKIKAGIEAIKEMYSPGYYD